MKRKLRLKNSAKNDRGSKQRQREKEGQRYKNDRGKAGENNIRLKKS